jgi:hypothetical protein
MLLALCAMLATISTIHAEAIGLLALGSGGQVTASLTAIVWGPDPSSIPAGNGTPAAPWNAQVGTATHLSFSGCNGVLGSAGCLDSGPFAAAEAVTINHDVALTTSTLLPVDGFLLFAGNTLTHAGLDYTLTALGAGSSNTNCAALSQFQSCSVWLGSPVVLTMLGQDTNATLSLSGTVNDSTRGPATPWVGSFSTTFTGLTPGDVQRIYCPSGTCTPADFARGTTIGTSVAGTFQADVVPEVPEPGTFAVLGVGLVAIGYRLRKFKNVGETH